MFGKKKKKEFKFSEALIEKAQAVEASAKKSSAKPSSIEAEVKDDGKRQKLAEKQAQIKHLEHQLTKTEADVRKATKKRRTTARAKTDQQIKHSAFQFAGKHNNAKAKSPADKLADAAARYKLNDYGNNVSQRAKDRDLAKQHNINNAKRVHDSASNTTWLTIASACEAFGMLEVTLRRLCSNGTLLSRNTGKTILISSATIDDFLNKL